MYYHSNDCSSLNETRSVSSLIAMVTGGIAYFHDIGLRFLANLDSHLTEQNRGPVDDPDSDSKDQRHCIENEQVDYMKEKEREVRNRFLDSLGNRLKSFMEKFPVNDLLSLLISSPW